jgi:carboxymethylenebutenolidase
VTKSKIQKSNLIKWEVQHMVQKRSIRYEEGTIDMVNRRTFMKKMTLFAGSTAVTYSLLPLREARADIISADDPRLQTQLITYPGDAGDVQAYLARPKASERLPAVIVIHENRGLQPHIKDVTRRMALEGFLAMAPDALSPFGGTPEDEDAARSKMRELDYESTKKNFVAANATGKVGCTGFCWGGAMANQVAVNAPDLNAAVPYYGRQPDGEDVSRIKASLLLHYAGLDERINAGIPAFEKALKEASIDYRLYMYEGAQHAFNNDSNPDRYHKEAAELAWKRTIDFFKEKLKT